MHKLLGRFKLRNSHFVYETDSGFEVTQVDPHGVSHSYEVSQKAADFVFGLCKGECVTAEEASGKLYPYAKNLALPFHYGHKLRYYTQEILLVLAATKRATVLRRGRRFEYQITH